MADDDKIGGGEQDLISTLPDVLLQQILCVFPTEFAITTSILSKRWRHAWCNIPSLSINTSSFKLSRLECSAPSINKTLTHYTAPKIMNFELKTTSQERYEWIEFAMSRNVENMSLDFSFSTLDDDYTFPDFFYVNSYLKQLTIELSFCRSLSPICSVSWTSLKKLSLCCCKLSDETLGKILSGCPILESLTLYFCDELEVLDLSKSLCLRTLTINRNVWVQGPTQIVAPHIHCLRLINSQLPCTLVDVASLTEAKLDICFVSLMCKLKADILQVMVLNMLDKLQNVERLTFGGNFLEVLSLAELRGVPFPILKVKALTFETVIFQYVIPGIKRLLQNSPDLEKLIVLVRDCNTIPGVQLNKYLKSQGLNTEQCWRSKDGVWNYNRWDVERKHMVSFLELMRKNTNALAKMVVLLDKPYLKFKVQSLPHYNNVVIGLKPKTGPKIDEWES